MRIICEKIERGHWHAWVEGNAEMTEVGRSAVAATSRLLASLPGVTADHIAPDNALSHPGRYVFRVGDPCQDCKGSGKYVGLVEISDCATCRGTGRVFDDDFDDGAMPF